jgi:hypothetical protein
MGAELGLYGMVIVSASIVAGAAIRRSPADLLAVGIFVSTLAAANVALVIFFRLTSANYGLLFDYQGYALEILRGFNGSMGLPWEFPWTKTIVLVILALYVLVVVSIEIFRKSEPLEACLLASFLLASFISLRGAFARSDAAHIIQAFTPMIFLFVLLVTREWEAHWIQAVWGMFALGILFVSPFSGLNAAADLFKAIRGQVSLASVTDELLAARKPTESDASAPVAGGSQYLQSIPLVTFRYDNYLALGLPNVLLTPILESDAASTEALQQHYVATLEKQRRRGMEFVYGLDMRSARGNDGVQEITRSPIIFEYLYRSFALASGEERTDGYYLLRLRPAPRIAHEEELLFVTRRQTTAFGVLELRSPSTCGLLRLDLRVKYDDSLYRFKRAGIDLSFSSSDQVLWQGAVKPVENDPVYSTYVSLLHPSMFYKVFGDAAVPGTKWNRLEYRASPTDMLGSRPVMIEVAHVYCVGPEMPVEPAPPAR